jgi:Fur family transcriptional regulator, ferric uptake regulator
MVAKINEITDLLKSKGLNVTEIRRQLVALLFTPGSALTQKEIEEELEQELGSVDRVTLYRNLRILMEKQVIHQITIDAQTVKYKLAGAHKKTDHPHFHCSCCDKLLCMPQVKIAENMLPGGFVIKSSQLIIEGLCDLCNASQKPDHSFNNK